MIKLEQVPESLLVFQYYVVDIFSGFLIIMSGYYTFAGDIYPYNPGEKLLNALNYISKDIFKFLLFILSSWVIGYLARECVSLIPISGIKKSKKKETRYLFEVRTGIKWSDEPVFFNKILTGEKTKNWDFSIKQLNRHLHIMSTAGSAFIIIAFLFFITFIIKLFIEDFKIVDLIMSLTFIFFTIACEKAHKNSVQALKEAYKMMLDQME